MRFEHKATMLPWTDDQNNHLDEMSRDGWELVAVVDQEESKTWFYWKRPWTGPVDEPEDEW